MKCLILNGYRQIIDTVVTNLRRNGEASRATLIIAGYIDKGIGYIFDTV